ncbi:hypothetical protein [Rickettsia endosymbiont of Urophora cardui]|uniref:hypothetical protein n=1 Tax=Rickettsia endosymbiont of Urophora cardui TaxID=3066265 RepID=UPI00313B3618
MEESSYIHKSHNVTVLIYHLVTPAKYRRVGKHGDEQKLRNYVQNQGSGKPAYKAFQQKQLKLFG